MRKRTSKTFVPYNDYQDRPFGLKWGTAFALDELTQAIDANKKASLKKVIALPQMSRDAIDEVLQKAFLKSLHVSIQQNEKDENGILLDNIEGPFLGIADAQNLYIESHEIPWDLIRNVAIIKPEL